MRTHNTSIFVLLFLIIVAFSSCKKDKKQTIAYDHFIFGRFYGMCAGEECVEIFKIESGKLYEDVNDVYPSHQSFYTGNYMQLSDEKYQKTKDIVDYFPSDLLNETDTIIGAPDAGDWGGHYIEYRYNGTRRFWLMDKMKTNVDSKYHLFIDKLNERIDSLK